MLASSKPVDAFKPSNIHQWSTSLLVSLITLFVYQCSNRLAYVFGHFWFILGMAIALLTISSASLHYYSANT